MQRGKTHRTIDFYALSLCLCCCSLFFGSRCLYIIDRWGDRKCIIRLAYSRTHKAKEKVSCYQLIRLFIEK